MVRKIAVRSKSITLRDDQISFLDELALKNTSSASFEVRQLIDEKMKAEE